MEVKQEIERLAPAFPCVEIPVLARVDFEQQNDADAEVNAELNSIFQSLFAYNIVCNSLASIERKL